MTKKEYFVAIKYYRYNSGASDNGFIIREEKNSDLNALKELVSKLKESHSFRTRYVEGIDYAGYVVEVGDIFFRETKEELQEGTKQVFKEAWMVKNEI